MTKSARKGSRKKAKYSFRNGGCSPSILKSIIANQNVSDEATFQALCARLKSLFIKYSVEDVFLALNISDLWLHNISACVKHQLAFSICVSIPHDDFGSEHLDTYERFTGFVQAVIDILPSFPTLEDYWPEADWGDIMFIDGVDTRPVFYGCSVQRIPDFIEAFRILYGGISSAMTDMNAALCMQSELLERVRRPEEDFPESVQAGYIEIPPIWFWDELKVVLPIVSGMPITSELVAALGSPTTWDTGMEFGDAVMQGKALPWLGVQVGKRALPLSLRNGPVAVLEYWSRKSKAPVSDAIGRFVDFLVRRTESNALLAGPFLVVSRRAKANLPIAAVFSAGDRHYLIVLANPGGLATIDKQVDEVRRVIKDNRDWAFLRIGTSDAFQLRNDEGSTPMVTSLEFIIVVGVIATSAVKLPASKLGPQIVTMDNAITLFDAMQNINELDRFWRYEAGLRQMGGGGMSDLIDMFASFRDSHGQIIGGAMVPNMVMLDPHWGSNWRYSQLQRYWGSAPESFPDERSAWDTTGDERDQVTTTLRRVIARNLPRLAWSCRIGSCTVHFVLDVDLVSLNVEDGRVLETFVHCAADCLAERVELAASILTLPYKRVVIECLAQPGSLATLSEEEGRLASNRSLLDGWSVIEDQQPLELRGQLIVSLSRVQARLEQVEDASFEVECATELLDILAQYVCGRPLSFDECNLLAATAIERPRFVMRRLERTVDVPDFVSLELPTLENYKVARRSLAELLKLQGVEPGRYELDKAKALINAARAAYRDAVHERLQVLDRDSVIRFLVRQSDAVCAQYDNRLMRTRHSLSHDVDYDREQLLSEANEQFTRNSRNLRYAVEAALFLTEAKPHQANSADALEVIAMVDWLFVLYQASDVLHNGIDVGGLLVDDQYIPEIFYSETHLEQQQIFALEMASLRLGEGVVHGDQLKRPLADDDFRERLDTAFMGDLGFTYSNLVQIISTLVHWVSVGGGSEFSFGYIATRQDIARVASSTHEGLDQADALRAIDFLVLDATCIRRLAGVQLEVEDVPVWEHSKRTNRYMIKPLIRLTDDCLLWGAAMADRTARIWMGAISNGYMPADFLWPLVTGVVRDAKKSLEGELENAAHAISTRSTPFTVKGLDCMRRFPREGFADVGDFDLVAYWPEGNRWLIGECKYNQPAFCLKDARRLRDRIFSRDSSGQFVKIERRRQFFANHVDRIRQLLGWPDPGVATPNVTEIYICKDLHWWLRFPPYDVPTHFAQIDMFDSWLSKNGFVSSGCG